MQATPVAERTPAAPTGELFFDILPSPIGALFVAAAPGGVARLEFHPDGSEADQLATARGVPVRHSPEALAPVAAQLGEYFDGRRHSFEVALDLGRLTPFERSVLALLATIPHGQTRTYGEMARLLGSPGASQAVGQALGRNPIPLLVPCHRVIAGSNRLGGYSGRGGLETKLALLRLEGGLLL